MFLFTVVFTLILSINQILADKGTVNLDEHSFSKVINKFDISVVKFDPSYPYGEKHEAFMKVADELKDKEDILMAQVGIKDWGDKENENLGKKYGVDSKADYPALRLFVQGEDQPFEYKNTMPWTVDDIKRFIRDHSNIYLGLPGCLEKFDKLASEFSSGFDKKSVYEKAKTEAGNLTKDYDKKVANHYLTYMKKALDKESFIADEKKRLNKLVQGKISQSKKDEISQKINILSAFTISKSEL